VALLTSRGARARLVQSRRSTIPAAPLELGSRSRGRLKREFQRACPRADATRCRRYDVLSRGDRRPPCRGAWHPPELAGLTLPNRDLQLALPLLAFPRPTRIEGDMHRIRLRVGRFTVLPVLFLALASFVLPHPTNADAPRRGGVLLAAIGADPTSLDPHQESPSPPSSSWIQLVAPPYSTRVLSPSSSGD
jgi:hypothetical protein